MKKLSFLFILVIFLVTGCTHKVYLALKPDYSQQIFAPNALSEITPGIKFVRGDFEDRRDNQYTYATFRQQIHTYELYASRPIADAVFDGLAIMLEKSGHSMSDDGDGQIRVNLQLLASSAERVTGFVTVGANASIQIKLDFIDTGSGNSVYSQIYNGKDERAQGLVGLMDMVKKSVDASIANCVTEVSRDRSLAQALKK